MSKYRAYIAIGEFDTEAEAVTALELYEQDGTSTLVKEVQSE